MSQNDLAYYRSRAAIEREMAQLAASPEIAAIHDELARGYQALIDEEERRMVPIRLSA